MRPISRANYLIEPQADRGQSDKLKQLRRMLSYNQKTQEKLKKIHDTIRLRMETINQFISTYRLKNEYPLATGIISYIKFERSTPHALREQSRVIEQQQAIKNTNEKDFEFIKKLNNDKPKSIRNNKDVEIVNLPQNIKLINFTEMAAVMNFKAGIDLYRIWLEKHHKRALKNPFDQKEQQIIIQKQKIYGDNWEKVCQFVQTRTFQQIYYQFHNRLNPKIITGRWNYRQSLMLIILCEHFGVKKWAQIAQKMVIKSELQVRERFCNIIDPSVGKNVWSQQLQARLLEIAPEQNYCWKQIAKRPDFVNKTDNSIWRKYRNLMMPHTEEQIHNLMPGGKKKGLIEKIIKYKKTAQAKKKLKCRVISVTEKSEMSAGQIEKIPLPNTHESGLDREIQVESQNSLSYIVYQ